MDTSDYIAKLAAAKLDFISANREKLVTAWIAETGLRPTESMLVFQELDGVTRCWVEPNGGVTAEQWRERALRAEAELRKRG